jgi:hypothetical protein
LHSDHRRSFYKRYDAKKGKKPPEGAIPCCEPDPVTGHHPHWVKVDFNAPENSYIVEAYINSQNEQFELWRRSERSAFLRCGDGSVAYTQQELGDGTYEAIGPHIQGNPYEMDRHILVRHGKDIAPNCPCDFEGIKAYLRENEIEGVVFWKDGEPLCKIKRTDFGYRWPVR